MRFSQNSVFVMFLFQHISFYCNVIVSNTLIVLQDVPGARDYFSRKIKFVTEQMEKIQKIASEKSKLREGGFVCLLWAVLSCVSFPFLLTSSSGELYWS